MINSNLTRRILMYCGSGYAFGEYFKPLIEDLIADYEIEFLQGDYYLTAATKDSLESFSARKQDFSYRIVHVLGKNESVIKYHRQMLRLIDSLKKKAFDLLILPTDFYLIDRYLINLARSQGAKVVIIQANVMNTQVLLIYREKMGLVKDKNSFLRKVRNKVFRERGLIKNIIMILPRIFRRMLKSIRIARKLLSAFENYYIWPWFFSRTVFRQSRYDKFSFTCGRGDAVICYDPMEAAALKMAIPTLKNVYLTKHPLSSYAADLKTSAQKKILALLGGYSVELPEEQILLWSRTIKRITEKIKLDEVHLRFHPRTDKKLSWPKKSIDLISNYGCKVIVVNALEVPLVESIPDYVGIIGAMSGSLRTARAVSKGFVIGLLNAGGECADESWMLGSAEGIIWISNAEEIKEEHLIPPTHIGDNLPRVSEILKGLLSNNQETSFGSLREKKENIAVIIQARMGSSRLPGKVLMRVNGRTLLDYMIERVKKSKTIDKVIIATTQSSSDDLIARWCEDVNLPFYRGSEEDVLSRYYEAAKKYNASVIVRLTSDCPLIDPEVIDLVVRCYLNRPDIDFVSNTVPLPCLYPDGMDVEVFDMDLLAKANQEATLPSEREHVTFYMWKTGKFRIYRLDPPEDLSKYRFCIDYPQDFQVMKEILTRLYSKNPDFSMYDLIAFMEENPQLLELQQGIKRNAGWEQSFAKDREMAAKLK